MIYTADTSGPAGHPNLFLTTLATLLLLAGCSDEPTNVGDEIIGGDLEVERIVLTGEAISLESGIAVVSNSSNQLNDAVLVGTAEDGTVAHGLFNLVERSSRLDAIPASEIQRAELRFRTVDYRYGGGTGGQTGFDVVYFDGTFGNAAQYSSELAARIEAGTELASILDDLPDSANYRIELDREATADFLNGYYELETVDDGKGGETVVTNTLLSIGLRANGDGETIAALLGASVQDFADSLLPSLIVTLADTVITLQMGVSNWIVDYPDAIQTGPGKGAVAAGAPIRTLLSFSLDSIPQNALIVKAELTMHIQEGSEMSGTTGPIENVVAYIAGPDPLTSPSRLATFPTAFGTPIYTDGSRPAEDTTRLADLFRFSRLNGAVTNWLRYLNSGGTAGYENHGLIIALGRSRPDLESATVDRLAFVGPDGPADLQPRLEIVFARPASQ